MQTKFLIIPLFTVALQLKGQQNADAVLGSWISTDNTVAVKVYKVHESEYRAKVIWFDDRLGSGIPMGKRVDDLNPDPAKRNRKILGAEILTGLKYNPKSNSWENGKIYDATSGRYWDSSAKFHNLLLKVRGFWKFKWIGKSMSFRRLNEKL